MEDQQSSRGDLTEASADDASAADATVTAATELEAAQGDESSRAATESAENGTAEVDADQLRADDAEAGADTDDDNCDRAAPARRPAGKATAVAVGVAAALFVGSAAFAGAAVQPYLADRALVATKLEIARTAANAITTLWTYTPESMDTLADRAAAYLSGDFEAQYRKFVDAIMPVNKQAKVTDSTVITGAAVESLNGPEATVMVYTNTTATSAAQKAIPSLKYLSYRVFMRRDHAHWLVTRMSTITSLDLTPKL